MSSVSFEYYRDVYGGECGESDFSAVIETAQDAVSELVGGTGISDDQFRHAISLGVRKINIATASFDAHAAAAKTYSDGAEKPDYFKLSPLCADAVRRNVVRHINVFLNRQ